MARTAVQIAELLRQRLAELDMSGFADLFAQDSLFEYPFGFPGAPNQIRGREAIREHLVESRRPIRDRIVVGEVVSTVHETVDPNIAVVETTVAGVTKATGRSFRFSSAVSVITARDGEVVHYRDYTNVLGSAAATGRDVVGAGAGESG